jgi:hypothetical protein
LFIIPGIRIMKVDDPSLDQLLPMELKLRILEREMERLDSDISVLQQQRDELSKEINCCNEILESKRRRANLKRVK